MEEPNWVEPLIKSLSDKGWRMFDNNSKMISFEIGDIERGRLWRDYYKDTGDLVMYNPDQKVSIRVEKEK